MAVFSLKLTKLKGVGFCLETRPNLYIYYNIYIYIL